MLALIQVFFFKRDRLQCWIFIWPYISYCDLAIVIVTRFATSLDIFVLIISQCWSWIWYSTTFTSWLIPVAWLDIALVISLCAFVCLEVCPLSLTTVWLSINLQPEQEFSKLLPVLLNICDSDVSSTSELEVSEVIIRNPSHCHQNYLPEIQLPLLWCTT